MKPVITSVAYYPTLFVAEHLRAIDREEISAVRGDEFSPAELALDIDRIGRAGFAWTAWSGEGKEPVAIWGAMPLTRSCVSAFAFATDSWDTVVRSVTRHIWKIMIPELLRAGNHRAECRALAKRKDTERWLTGFGWRPEALLSRFGAHHEDFVLYAWTANDGTHHTG